MYFNNFSLKPFRRLKGPIHTSKPLFQTIGIAINRKIHYFSCQTKLKRMQQQQTGEIMKLKLNKKQLKNLSKDNKALPVAMTPQIGGGKIGAGPTNNVDCNSYGCLSINCTLDCYI